MEPDEQTVAPAAMSRRLSITTPTNAAARPAVALRNEMSTGMSAPPMRIENTTPRTMAEAITATMSALWTAPALNTAPSTSPVPTRRMRTRIALCRLYTVGRWSRRLASFPAAIMLPAKVAEPTMSPT